MGAHFANGSAAAANVLTRTGNDTGDANRATFKVRKKRRAGEEGEREKEREREREGNDRLKYERD